ncbi:unnamed protein product (macronuclear) [Paramecium tetraurelia]|uniref:Cache domain-containing protein n=1 Tax=Paramecium tetraurelia TaxID=5888 RepID=A0CH73_PARTE|nr:uncharacterized protein GSPATT00007580001 [Paramecium tetraurelia]CAK70140.1 unnamed protein product [Paramecium tetraurelia]|eukprot:XP_001437537.1 hypothetical protein (macronuclear) [Paramecium tetraurelia strain d4-2]
MLNKLSLWFKNLRMSNQIIIVNLLIIILAVLLVMTTGHIQQAIFFSYVQEVEQALTLKQEKSLVNNISRELRIYIQQKNYQTILNLWHSQQMFYQLIQKQSQFQIKVNQFQDCVEQEDISEDNIIYNSDIFCQGLYTKQYDSQAILLNQTISLLIPFSQLFLGDEQNKISFIDVPNNQIFAQYPRMYKYKNYVPSTRPWYTNHIAQYEINPKSEYFYSPIYTSVRSFMPYFSLTYSLIINSTLFGITSQLQEIYDKNIQSIPMSIFLVNQNGDIILTTMPSISKTNVLITITNETYTGFNQSDWDLVQKNSKQKNAVETNFYLENKIFKKPVFVNAFNFEKENLTLIVQDDQKIGEKLQDLVDTIRKSLIQDVQIYVGICIFLVLITTSLIRYISAPLLNLIQVINIHVKKIGNNLNSEIFKMAIKNKKQTDLYTSLAYSFLGFKDLQTRRSESKNQTCKSIDEIKYSFQYQETDSSKIKESILLLNNYEASENLNKYHSFEQPLTLRNLQQNQLWITTDDETSYRLILIKQLFQQLFQKQSLL